MWMSPQSFDPRGWTSSFGIVRRGAGVAERHRLRTPGAHYAAGAAGEGPERISHPALSRHHPQPHSRNIRCPIGIWPMRSPRAARPSIRGPLTRRKIFRLYQTYAIGFLTYSEGVNDDVNKFVWSGLGWNPDARQSSTFCGISAATSSASVMADAFAQGLMALERNWCGPLMANERCETTLDQFRRMERTAPPRG